MSDLHAASAAYADEETVDTDFVHHLVRGADLLQAGDAEKSRSMLERALQLRPDNERGQNLLALSYFKLGLLDRAAEIYRTLLGNHPEDPALRVNLGLVLLKQGHEDEAIGLFKAALERVPEHRKAQNYIGLAYMQKREFAAAREWFDRSGNLAMSERMSLALASTPLSGVADAGMRVLDRQEVPFSPPDAVARTSESGWVATPPPATAETPAPEPAEPPDLATFSEASRIDAGADHPEGTFALGPAMVTVTVKGELFTRVDGLLATFGNVDFKPELKRFRGRVTDKPFGEAGRRMMRVNGDGRLWIALDGRHFQAVEIGDEAAYFREDVLFAFEETLLFENGRVPSRQSTDLQLVHLRGRGRALIVSRNRPRSVDIRKGEPCRLPVEVLLGWHGNVAPRIVTIGQDDPDKPAMPAVELTGEGRALLDASL